MQEITPGIIKNTSNLASKTLTDRRDSKTYSVGKIAGSMWMTKNLDLAGGTSLYSETSNVPRGYNSTAFNTLAASNISSFVDSATDGVYNSGNTNCSTGACYSYYSFKSAAAGTAPSGSTLGDVTSDICPRGWKLPARSDFETLTGVYTTAAQLNSSPFNTNPAGWLYYGTINFNGGLTQLWTSYGGGDMAYYLYASKAGTYGSSTFTDRVLIQNGRKVYGNTVRCIGRLK
jgi:uncharacterized protein (TIGR02145 family)